MSQAQLDEKDAKIAILQRALAERASELAPKEFMKRMGEGLKCQFEKLGDELRKTQELLAAASSRASRAEQEVERLGESSKTLERELEESRTRITSLESSERERDTLREKSAKLSLVVDRLRESEQALKTERAQLLQEKNNMGTAYAEERATLEEKCAQLEREKTTLETARAQTARENANLEAENARLTENNTTLEAEQARLLQEKATAESTIAELRAEKQNAELRAGRAATYLEMHAQTHAVFEDMRQTILQQRERIAAYETQEEAFKEATARVEEMRTQMDALVDREVQASQRYADLEQEKVKADAELNSVLAREAQLLEQVEALEKGQVRMRELEDDLERAKAQIVALEAHAKQTSDSAQQMLHDARENFNRTLQAKDDVWNAKDEELRRAQEQARAAVQQCQQLAIQLQAAKTQLAQAQTHILSLQTQVQNAGPTYQEVLALRAQVTNLQNQVQQYGQVLNNRDARVASLEIQLQQAQGSKARRSQDAQTEPILVLRVSKQELEAREGKKDGSVQAKLEDNTMALVKRSATEAEIAALVAERDDLLQQVKGQDDLQKSLLDQVEAANRTNAVLRSELSRLHEIRYTTGAVLAAKPGDASTPTVAKPTLGPSNAANAQPEAGPSTIRPAKSLSPGSKENALPRTQTQSHQTAHAVAPPSSSVVSEPVFGRVVQQNLRSQTWPTSGHMWLNIMVCPMEGGSVPLRVLLEAFVRDSGSAVDAAEFGALVRQWGDRMFAGRMQLVGDALRGVAMNDGTTAKTALVPATPRAPPPAAAPRSLPTPATAPRPPPPAGPRPPLPARLAAPRPPPPPAQVKAEPDTARAAPAKRRTAEGPAGEERPVKRARSGSPSAASSSEAPASSPTRRIASSSRELASLPLTRRAPAAAPAAVKVSTAAQSATTEAELPTKHKPKPKPAQAQAGPSSQPAHAPVNARSSSSSQRAESSSSQRAGSSSSQRPGTSSSSRQEPARVDPEHTHDVAWDIEESGMEDLFVLWLRQGILRDISSTVSRSVAVQRATETLRRRGWVAEDGSFVVPKTSSEYRYARFGQLTISTALGFFDF